jgi:hypothetical protein
MLPGVRRYGAAEVLLASSLYVGWFIGNYGNSFNGSPRWRDVLFVGAFVAGMLALRALTASRQH